MDCPVCNKSFLDKNLFTQHIEEHKINSILNNPPEPTFIQKQTFDKLPTHIDLGDLFVREKFEKAIHEKMKQKDDVDELVHRWNFIEQIKKIASKHPFVYLPYFIKDLLNGISSADLLKKYHLLNHLELKYDVQRVLGFDQNRYQLKHYDDAFIMNMKIPTWKEKYDVLQDNCKFFKNELLELTFHNILRSFILVYIQDYIDTGISRKDMLQVSNSLRKSYDLFRFVDDELRSFFAVFYERNFEQTVQNILDELFTAKILKHKPGTSDMIVGKMSLDVLKKSIIHSLKHNNGSKTESTLRTEMKYKYPSLQLLPGLGVWDVALKELISKSIVQVKSKHNFRHSSIVFLNENYQKIQQQLRMSGEYNVEFHGRKISPDIFIDELKELEKGDFDDKDDQVTRIAGLILAESVNLQAPHESIPQFDFSMDITNYHFRGEQLDAMRKMNFKINSNIFHYRVMLFETLTLEKYNDLRLSIPKNEQGVVVTFEDIPVNVQAKLNDDDTLQIINEDGIRIWVSVTSKIPVRVGSIAKLHSDPISNLEKKLVKVNLLNYEYGIASVTILQDNYEATVLSRSLEEVELNKTNPKNFEMLTSRYLKFLNVLMNLTSSDDLVRGLFEMELYESTSITTSKSIFNFRHSRTDLDLDQQNKNDILQCDCMRWAENKINLCPHLVYSLDHMTRRSFLSSWYNDDNGMKNALEYIIRQIIPVILDRLGFDPHLEDEHYENMKEFINYASQINED